MLELNTGRIHSHGGKMSPSLVLQTLYPKSRGKDIVHCPNSFLLHLQVNCGSLQLHEYHYGIVLAVCRGMTTHGCRKMIATGGGGG